MQGFTVQIFDVITSYPHYTFTPEAFAEMAAAAKRAGNQREAEMYKMKWALALEYKVNHVTLVQQVAV